MKLDDNVLTKMVDAAAKSSYGRAVQSALTALGPEAPTVLPEWDELPPLEKNRWRQQVLLVVWDAAEAMPDVRYDAWEVGYLAGISARDDQPTAVNPYPAPEVAL